MQAVAVPDERIEAQVHMLEAYPELKGMYTPGDGNTEVFFLKDVTATFRSEYRAFRQTSRSFRRA